jgi:hypothetical protein
MARYVASVNPTSSSELLSLFILHRKNPPDYWGIFQTGFRAGPLFGPFLSKRSRRATASASGAKVAGLLVRAEIRPDIDTAFTEASG